jgi:hypothetical protein
MSDVDILKYYLEVLGIDFCYQMGLYKSIK